MSARRNDRVLIIGAGFAGIGMGIRLKQAGIDDFTILERADRVGGTWRDNTYPGIACDVPSHLYSYSFEPRPTWSRLFAPQAEILDYLEHCVRAHGLGPHLRLGTAAIDARFDERAGLWTVRTSGGGAIVARVLVSGSGHALSRPVLPDLAGRERFAGKTMHSARWDHAYPLEGRRVAVIGTGASAVQLVPAIAPRVARLHVFQRTASWVLPKPDVAIPPAVQRLLARAPLAQRLLRAALYCLLEAYAVGYVVEPRLNVVRERHARRFLQASVRDPALREKLTPRFRLGCKRILLTNDYYPALQRDNVELVTDAIREVRAGSIVTADGAERPVDTIVYATGYEAAETTPPFPIVGRGGRTLHGAWRAGGEAYLGTTIAGFPSFFMLIGPNLGLGHNSMILMMEAQFDYVVDAIRTMRASGLRSVDVRAPEQARYNAWVQRRLARSVWNTGGCRSWYVTRAGKNTTAWPGFTFEFFARTRRFDAWRYDLVPEGAPRVEEVAPDPPLQAASRPGDASRP